MILTLVILVLIALFWYDSMNCREMATRRARTICGKNDFQFLDGTVALKQIRLRRKTSGQIVFYRQYLFEFSDDGLNRWWGTVDLFGNTIVSTHLSQPLPGADS